MLPNKTEAAHAESGSPHVTEMHVIPVAGEDSMLLNLSGAHGPPNYAYVGILAKTLVKVSTGPHALGDKLAASNPERNITGRHLDARRTARLGFR
jgi:hypothetical protein